jgi:thymidylate synthase (FAD)
MKLVKPSFHILTDINGIQILKNIERIGRVCYKSEDKITDDSAQEFVRRIIKRGHESVIEHENVSVHFTIDRGVSHELVRHRLAAYAQESTRYCDYKGYVEFIIPLWCTNIAKGILNISDLPQDEGLWLYTMQQLEHSYEQLRNLGWSPQQARSVLPNSLKTEIVVTCNLREWRHIFKLRTSPAAHPQMREIMEPLLWDFQNQIPVIFEDI